MKETKLIKFVNRLLRFDPSTLTIKSCMFNQYTNKVDYGFGKSRISWEERYFDEFINKLLEWIKLYHRILSKHKKSLDDLINSNSVTSYCANNYNKDYEDILINIELMLEELFEYVEDKKFTIDFCVSDQYGLIWRQCVGGPMGDE